MLQIYADVQKDRNWTNYALYRRQEAKFAICEDDSLNLMMMAAVFRRVAKVQYQRLKHHRCLLTFRTAEEVEDFACVQFGIQSHRR